MPAFEMMKSMGGGEVIDMDTEKHMQRLVARQAARNANQD